MLESRIPKVMISVSKARTRAGRQIGYEIMRPQLAQSDGFRQWQTRPRLSNRRLSAFIDRPNLGHAVSFWGDAPWL
jgi:hypothetical protein